MRKNSYKFSIAPMMEYTDRHFRYLLRLLSRRMLLYTEMIHTGAILHGDREAFLHFHECEHPVAIQLGGSDEKDLAACARIASDYGYDEINLNVGCPSPRVVKGRFGACLMAEAALVARCVAAMRALVDIPITVKTRIGIDDQDSFAFLADFVDTVQAAGVSEFIIHARKAWLNGLSPKENRTIPPLQYETVYQLKKMFPSLTIVINGGFTSFAEIAAQYEHVDGVMVGREAYHNPYFLTEVDRVIFQETTPPLCRERIVLQYLDYIESQLQRDVYLKHMAKHLLSLFHGEPGARQWRRHLSENIHKKGAGGEVILAALAYCT